MRGDSFIYLGRGRGWGGGRNLIKVSRLSFILPKTKIVMFKHIFTFTIRDIFNIYVSLSR